MEAAMLLKPEALVPIWVGKSGIRCLDKMDERPVLIQAKSIGAVLRGQILDLQMAQARVQAGDPILIWQNTHVVVRFRFGDTVYSLSGMTTASYPDHSFCFEFDAITRRNMRVHGGQLRGAGLLQGEDLPPEPEEASEDEDEPQPSARPPKEDLVRVRHEDPPDGIERREHPRHEVQLAATLHFVNTAVVLPCLLIEMSEGGCRVFSDSPIDFERETAVELRFVAHGYPYRLPALIWVKTTENLAGLKFHQMSERIHQRLLDFLQEL